MKDVDPQSTALVVIDVQKAFQDWERTGAGRNNPEALANIAALLDGFRAARSLIFHIRHRGTAPDSLFQGAACDVIPEAAERDGEPVLWKTVNSAFIGTDLEAMLREWGIRTVVISGATSNHCVETTARVAGNLGFTVYVVDDATATFDRTGYDGQYFPAEAVHALSLASLHGEFATVVTTDQLLG